VKTRRNRTRPHGRKPRLYLPDGTPYFGDADTDPVSSRVEEIDFKEFADGSLAELVEDPDDPSRTALLWWKEGKATYTRRIEDDGRIYVPLQRDTEILRGIRLPKGIKPCQTVTEGALRVGSLLSTCVALEPLDWHFIVSTIVSSWFAGGFSIAPYLSIIGSPGSGKTTLLKTLALLCWRPLLVADTTSASFYDACRQLTPTLLIDEIVSHTGQSRRSLYHLLRTGSTRDVLAMKTGELRHAFGLKVLASINPIDDAALNSRCIVVSMVETKRTDLASPDNPHVRRWAADIRSFLLYLRLKKLRTIRPARISGIEELPPRDRELCSVLAAPFVADKQWCQVLAEFFRLRGASRPKSLGPREEAVLEAVFCLAHVLPFGSPVTVGQVAGLARLVLHARGERIAVADRKAGDILTSLGLGGRPRPRTNLGYKLWLDLDTLQQTHHLARRHRIEILPIPATLFRMEACPLCQPPRRQPEGETQEPHPRKRRVSMPKAKKREKR
jgi:hypothetical protein